MDKEEILVQSRQENKGKYDEYEESVYGKSSRVGMLVGGCVCVALVLANELVFNIPELGLAGWFVYFAMMGSSNIMLYKNFRTRAKLILGISEIALSVAFAVAIIIKNLV